jgi:2-C-methyl-D-erythritol 2,4-cyclodiphosphate synthase
MIKTGLGQDSHRIQEPAGGKPLMLGGIRFEEAFSLEGNSDSDVILHAITNAVSGITGKPILGPVADALCKAGMTDSVAYLRLGLTDLASLGYRLTHVSVSVECARPKILPKLAELRTSLAVLLGFTVADVGITATSGEGLTDFGKGLGVQALAVVTAQKIS